MFDKFRRALQKNKFADKLMTNYDYRTVIFSAASFSVGVAYALYNVSVAVISGSVWYAALGLYYAFLDSTRAVVIFNGCKSKNNGCRGAGNGLKLYGVCGGLLVAMTVFLNAIIVQLVSSEKVYEYSYTLIYIVAGYTFYRIAISVYNAIKVSKRNNYVVRSLRSIDLAAAFVCFLSLQSAALSAFSKGTNHAVVNAITGCVVCVLIAALGAFMAVNSVVRSKKIRQGAAPEGPEKIAANGAFLFENSFNEERKGYVQNSGCGRRQKFKKHSNFNPEKRGLLGCGRRGRKGCPGYFLRK